jgi:RNA polymerase sigma factor (TIGR02999 family)
MADAPLKDYAAVLYDRLRALARARMLGQRTGHTLDPTGLANEAMVRLLNCDPNQINDEEHFMRLATEAMRQILVDHARAKATLKRGSGLRPTSLRENLARDDGESGDALALGMGPDQVLELNDALADFERTDPDAATVVKMRAFAGMNCEEIAALLNTSKRTIERRWRYALAELRVRLSDRENGAPGKTGPPERDSSGRDASSKTQE